MKYVRSITAPLSPMQARRFRDRFGITVLNGWGQTEIGGEIVGWSAQDAKEFGDTHLGAVGRAHENVELRIGDDGEILVQTPMIVERAATGDDFDGRLVDGWFRTGDLGRIDDEGFLWIEGRVSDMINRGGLKVFPEEVAEVVRLSPDVAECAVAGIPDDRLGEVPWAFVVPREGASVDADALDALCREHLAPYKVPVRFEPIDALPRNEVGQGAAPRADRPRDDTGLRLRETAAYDPTQRPLPGDRRCEIRPRLLPRAARPARGEDVGRRRLRDRQGARRPVRRRGALPVRVHGRHRGGDVVGGNRRDHGRHRELHRHRTRAADQRDRRALRRLLVVLVILVGSSLLPAAAGAGVSTSCADGPVAGTPTPDPTTGITRTDVTFAHRVDGRCRVLATQIRSATGATNPEPLVLAIHGVDGDPSRMAPLLDAWAAAGYVVVAPKFPTTKKDTRGKALRSEVALQADDARYVLDEVLDRADALHVDDHAVGVAGMSLGGMTVYGLISHTCCRDGRIGAAIVMAGVHDDFPDGTYVHQDMPVLLIQGDADVGYHHSRDAYPQLAPPKWFITLHGERHSPPFEVPRGRAAPVVDATTTAFWDRYLKGDTAAAGKLVAVVAATNGAATLQRDLSRR